MLQTRVRPLFRGFGLLLLFLLWVAQTPAQAKMTNRFIDNLIRQINTSFRSPSRYIPALDLYEQAYQSIPSEPLVNYSKVSDEEVLAALGRLETELQITRGVAENLLKVHRMTQLCKAQRSITPGLEEQKCGALTRDSVSGLSQKQLDEWVVSFPPKSTSVPHPAWNEWNYDLHEIARMAVTEMTNNDWYKFRLAAVEFMNGFHLSKRVTYNMFSRGKENRSYYIVGGTSLAVDALKYFSFSEREIQYLRHHPQFVNVSEDFFDYLRAWRFKGKVRAVPEGTVLFPNETILEVETDPVSGTIIEALLSPIIDTVTTSATKAARAVWVSEGRPIVEGGTRRSGHGKLGAYGALIGLAVGTSNTHVSRLFGTLPYGSMEHAYVGLFDFELEAFLRYLEVFPESTVLIDTNDILEGLRLALRAGRAAGSRSDSEMPGKTLGETTTAMQEFLENMGYSDHGIGVSNRINEFTLEKNPPAVSPHRWTLIGTEIQSPSDVNGSNIVFKLVQRTELATGAVQYVAKFSEGKVGIPGQTELWRVFRQEASGARDRLPKEVASHDVIATRGEHIEHGRPLLTDALNWEGQRLLPRPNVAEINSWTRSQLALFEPSVLDIHAKKGAYSVQFSPEMLARINEMGRNKESESEEYRFGVVIGSFDPVHEGHIDIGWKGQYLYALKDVFYVPASDDPVHGKRYKHPSTERVPMLKKEVEAKGMHVDLVEVNSETRYTLDTLRHIQARIRVQHPRAKMFVIVGEDLFQNLQTWPQAKELLNEGYSWVISKRGGDGVLHIRDELLGPGLEQISPHHYYSRIDGHVIESVDLRVGEDISSTRIRDLSAGLDTVFHGVDLQWTFWEPVSGREAGALAVPGSARILDNVVRLTQLARQNKRIKSILSKDYHYEVELRDPRWNGEFHPDMMRGLSEGHPPHGMAMRAGPAGHEILREVDAIYPMDFKLTIPHFREARGATAAEDQLELTPFDLNQVKHKLLDPRYQVIVQKNGPESYDFAMNPRAEPMVRMINPKRVIVYGLATDFCVKSAAKTYRKWGYEVWVVTDAISGVFTQLTEQAMREMEQAGVHFVTTDQVIEEYRPDCENSLE